MPLATVHLRFELGDLRGDEVTRHPVVAGVGPGTRRVGHRPADVLLDELGDVADEVVLGRLADVERPPVNSLTRQPRARR